MTHRGSFYMFNLILQLTDFKILIKSFKPTDTGILEESVENELVSRIEEMKMKVRSLYIG